MSRADSGGSGHSSFLFWEKQCLKHYYFSTWELFITSTWTGFLHCNFKPGETRRSAQQLADRNALYPNFGYLFPEGAEKVRKAFNETTVRAALEPSGRWEGSKDYSYFFRLKT